VGSGLSWESFDADLLDNFRATKRFASETAALDLAQMSMATSTKGARPGAEGGEHQNADAMACSSVECSPAARSAVAPPPQEWRTPRPAAPPAAPPKSLSRKGVLSRGERLPTSPNDTQLEGFDLRKKTLMRLLLKGGEEGSEPGQEGTPQRRSRMSASAQPAAGVSPALSSMECSPAILPPAAAPPLDL
jgi:hypothetical protein